MRRTILALFLLGTLARAQEVPPGESAEPQYTAGEWMTVENCDALKREVMPLIEADTRMAFRRPVPLEILPREAWEQMKQQEGFGGHAATHMAAYYTPGRNVVTMVPWNFEGPPGGPKLTRTAADWRRAIEATLIHEMVHAIHHQNFYSERAVYMASLKAAGLTEEEIDRSTVDFLQGEGFAELVALHTSRAPEGVGRHPERETESPATYMRRYLPDADGKTAFRIKLFDHGYQDGLTLMHHLRLQGGIRAVRAALYRPPPRVLLFQPALLGKLDLDDPPEPDVILRAMHPGPLSADGIFLAMNPGRGRFFAAAIPGRNRECLLGYTAKSSEGANDGGEYAFFVAHPDRPCTWVEEQAESLRALGESKESRVPLPVLKDATARLITAATKDGDFYVYAETGGLVVLMREATRTPLAEERALAALAALYIKRPKPKLYDEAYREALALAGGPVPIPGPTRTPPAGGRGESAGGGGEQDEGGG
jgi:hypothetical protein